MLGPPTHSFLFFIVLILNFSLYQVAKSSLRNSFLQNIIFWGFSFVLHHFHPADFNLPFCGYYVLIFFLSMLRSYLFSFTKHPDIFFLVLFLSFYCEVFLRWIREAVGFVGRKLRSCSEKKMTLLVSITHYLFRVSLSAQVAPLIAWTMFDCLGWCVILELKWDGKKGFKLHELEMHPLVSHNTVLCGHLEYWVFLYLLPVVKPKVQTFRV